MTGIRVALVCGILTVSSGCLFQKKPKIQVPVVVPPAPVANPVPEPAAEQPAVQIPAQTPPPVTTPPTETPKPSPFPAPSVPPPGRSTNPVRPTPTAPVAPAPSLGAVLSPENRKKLDAEYQADLRQANQTLGRVSGRGLTAEQLDSIRRARAFIAQAAQFHDRDLATAAELARRARVLTQDLASALK